MNVKALGSGCTVCKCMLNDANRVMDRNYWNIEGKSIHDITRITSYSVITTPVLVIDEEVVLVGHRGLSKIEHAMQNAANSQVV